MVCVLWWFRVVICLFGNGKVGGCVLCCIVVCMYWCVIVLLFVERFWYVNLRVNFLVVLCGKFILKNGVLRG